MNDNTQKALVHSSLEALKRAALNVLYEARDKGFIRQDVVRVRLGIPKIDYSLDPARHNALIFGILMHLKDDKYAYHNVGYGWQITEQEYYRNSERYEPPLRLPPLATPWTGRPMQRLLFESGE